MASKRNGTLYIGVTSDLIARVWQHRNEKADGFTATHRIHLLIYYEVHTEMTAAIVREKQIEKWKRKWKLLLIETMNPKWDDLYDRIL
jgi:putative endonuclease